MRYAVTIDHWNPTYQRNERQEVVVEADSGDEAVSRGRIAAMQTGIMAGRVVGVHPAPLDPEAPEAAVAPKGKAR